MSWGRVVLRCDRSLHDARSLTLGYTFWTVVVIVSFCKDPCPRDQARRSQPSDIGRGGASPQTSGEVEPALKRRARRSQPSDIGRGGNNPQTSGEAEPSLEGRTGRSQPLEASRGRTDPRGQGEAEPVALVAG